MKEKQLGISQHSLPSMEFLLRCLKELKPDDEVFRKNIEKIMVNVPAGLII